MSSRIIATGSYLPKKVVKNDDLRAFFDTSDEWIEKRTGIKQRHISTFENTADLGYQAAKRALDNAGLKPDDIAFIIVATMTPEYATPSSACLIQDKLEATQAFAFDINAACSGFVYAMHVANGLMNNASYRYGLVIGSEVMSKTVDWTDRATAILFGDGAGCVVLERQEENVMIDRLHSDGSKACSLTAGYKMVNNPYAQYALNHTNYLQMDGRAIFNFATKQIPTLLKETVEQSTYQFEDVDYFLLHQANQRMIERIAKKIDQPLEKFPMNVRNVGNLSGASLPVLLDECVQKGLILLDGSQRIMLAGFGAGLTWGSVLTNV